MAVLVIPSSPASKTPILDLDAPLPREQESTELTWRQSALIVFSILVVPAAIAVLSLSEIGSRALRPLARIGGALQPLVRLIDLHGLILVSVLFMIVPFVCLALHELGHLFAGRVVGFRFTSIQIGPLQFSRDYGGGRFRLQRQTPDGGEVDMILDRVRRLRKRLAFHVAAGPLANLASFLLAELLLRTPWGAEAPPLVRGTTQLFAFWSIFCFAGTIFPYLGRSGQFSDGARLLHLATSRAKSKRWWSLLALGFQQSSGVSMKLWKRTWIKSATSTPDRSRDALGGHLLAYGWAIANGDSAQAAEFLERCLERIRAVDSRHVDLLIAETALYHARSRNDPEKARAWLKRLRKPEQLPPLARISTDVAIRYAEKRYAEAIALCERGVGIIRQMPGSPVRARLEESWLAWKRQMETQLQQLRPQTSAPS
jgi:peptidase M50-like protein